MLTKAVFLRQYRAALAAYPWATDTAKVERFMQAVTDTLRGTSTLWAWNSAATRIVWKANGGKGRATLKGLRALPE